MTYRSQWNQDRWLNENVFHNKRHGFFVDVGAHDGIDINNTLFFEENLLWKGICIEPIPKIFEKLLKNRKAICINGCAYNSDGIVPFNMVEGYAEMLSGISSTYRPEHEQRINREMSTFGGNRQILSVNSYRLSTLFNTFGIKHVDYLSIDTEGSELQVLQGINFDTVNIDIIETEVNYKEDEDKITNFLISKGYEFLIKLGGDNIYKKRTN